VGGYLYIHSNCELKAPTLKSVGGYLYIHSNCELKALKSVGGDLYIYSNCELKALKSVGGELSIHSKIDNDLAIRLTNNCFKNQWYLSDKANNSLLRTKFPKVKYRIEDVYFEKELFDKVRKDKLTAEEVFSLENIEQRRVAYQKMDKIKMKTLKDFKVVDTAKDEQKKIMRIISFNIKGFDTPFYFLEVKCPTGREYFIETRVQTCWEAKMGSFGLPSDTRFGEEY
jgi:hypothetical protein